MQAQNVSVAPTASLASPMVHLPFVNFSMSPAKVQESSSFTACRHGLISVWTAGGFAFVVVRSLLIVLVPFCFGASARLREFRLRGDEAAHDRVPALGRRLTV